MHKHGDNKICLFDEAKHFETFIIIIIMYDGGKFYPIGVNP